MRARVLLGVSVVLALLTGCGDDDDSTTGSTSNGGSAGASGSGGSGATGGSSGQSGSSGASGSTGGSAGNGANGGSGGSAGQSGQSGSSGSGGIGGSGGAGGTFSWDDCNEPGFLCADGQACVPVTADYSVCALPTPEPDPNCFMGDQMCCAHADCAMGQLCVTHEGGAGIFNYCESDGCQTDADCAENQFCAQRGVLGAIVAMCAPAACHQDSDCGDFAGGRCAAVVAGEVGDCATIGLYCVYPNQGGCTGHTDCSATQHCEIDPNSGQSMCVDGEPTMCPPMP